MGDKLKLSSWEWFLILNKAGLRDQGRAKMIVPFYVEMEFEWAQEVTVEIMKSLRDKMHLAVYQGEPIFGKSLLELEQENK